jgi:protein-tyrosine phosphatase
MNYILKNLAIGSFEDAQDPPTGIDALLCVAQEIDLSHVRCLYYKVPIVDMQPIPEDQLKEAVVFIRDHIKDHKIMVYCNAGVGRSPSVVVAYLSCVQGYGYGEAVEFVASKKPYMSTLPNLILGIERLKEMISE